MGGWCRWGRGGHPLGLSPACPRCRVASPPLPSALSLLPGVQSVEVQLEDQMVLVQTTLPSQEVQALLEGTGRQAVLKGMGSGLLRE